MPRRVAAAGDERERGPGLDEVVGQLGDRKRHVAQGNDRAACEGGPDQRRPLGRRATPQIGG